MRESLLGRPLGVGFAPPISVAAIIFLTAACAGRVETEPTPTAPSTPTAEAANEREISYGGVSFRVPADLWETEPWDHQARPGIEYFTYSRTEPIAFGDDTAYYPNISVFIQQLGRPMDAAEYDAQVWAELEQSGMEFEILQNFTPGDGTLPRVEAVGWKVLANTAQGESMSYLVFVVNEEVGLRIILESLSLHFEDIDNEFLQIISSISIK